MSNLLRAWGRAITKVAKGIQQRYWAFNGGQDQVSPPISLSPGFARSALNFECGPYGGYTRIKGYERHDGRASPSDATYSIATATITGSPALGNTITGVSSGATGVVIALPGSSFVITKVVGTFTSGETINISGSPVATLTSAFVAGSASTAALNATYLNLAADQYRADIAAVPGTGNILGVIRFGSVTYAFRNNAGDTATDIYKSSGAGWVNVPLGKELSFTSGGTTEIAEGDTITGATSGATATVKRVVLTSGTWAGGTAAGKFIIHTQTGTFQAENLNVGAALNLATIAGNSSQITLTKSGRYKFAVHNFGGSVNTRHIYGADGKNRGFEFDGTDYGYVPIDTGMDTDTPNYVTIHKNHLFFAFGASVQHSGTGTPYIFTVVTGAAELAMGDDVTNFIGLPGDNNTAALGIYCRNKTAVLYGTSSSNWNLVTFSEIAGALANTAQFAGLALVLDDPGITTLGTTQSYGNFKSANISQRMDPTMRGIIDTAIDSCLIKDKNQYRLFFSGGTTIHITLAETKIIGLMVVSLQDAPTCVWSGEGGDGVETAFFGDASGYVYQMEKGTSFDGDAIAWNLEMAYNHMGSPRMLKSFRDTTLEIGGDSYVEYLFSYLLSYGQATVEQPADDSEVITLRSDNWDSGDWDAGFWDSAAIIPQTFDTPGDAENISIKISGSSDEFDSFTVFGAIVSYLTRRNMRP